MSGPVDVAGAVLAAGAGARLGTPKASMELGGRRLVDRAVDVLLEAGCRPVLAVVRPGVSMPAAVALVNPDPARGLRSSLALAVAAAAGHAALAVVLADQPGVGVDAVRAVLRRWRAGRVAVGRYPDGVAHPVVMSVADWRRAVTMADDDGGARAYLRAHPDLVDHVDVAGSARDLDTPADLAAWRAAPPSPDGSAIGA